MEERVIEMISLFNETVKNFNSTLAELKEENRKLNDRLDNAAKVIKELKSQVRNGNNITSTPVKETVPYVSKDNSSISSDEFGDILNTVFNGNAGIEDRKKALLRGIEMRDNGQLSVKQADTITKAEKRNSKLLIGTGYNSQSTSSTVSGTAVSGTTITNRSILYFLERLDTAWKGYEKGNDHIMRTQYSQAKEALNTILNDFNCGKYSQEEKDGISTIINGKKWKTLVQYVTSTVPEPQQTEASNEEREKVAPKEKEAEDNYGQQFEDMADGDEVMKPDDKLAYVEDENDTPF